MAQMQGQVQRMHLATEKKVAFDTSNEYETRRNRSHNDAELELQNTFPHVQVNKHVNALGSSWLRG